MPLWLIRHPRPAVVEGLCYGRSDLPLAEPESLPALAAARIAQLPEALRESPPAIYSSPLQRCRLLAEALAEQLQTRLEICDGLVEMDFGAWEMHPWAELPRQALDDWAADPLAYRGHGGEAVLNLLERSRQMLAQLPETALVVTHAGLLKAFHAHRQGLHHDEWFNLQFAYAEWVVL